MIRLAVRCAPEQAELVLAELLQIAPGGVEEDEGPGWVEYAIYGGEGELPELGEIEATLPGGTVEVRAEQIPDDWADRWRDFHEPVLIADRVWIRPSWHEARTGAVDVVVDPGQAFGTGAHPTTRMCIELLAELAAAGRAEGPLVDLGTGSGILAIVGAKLGWDPVRGVDSEQAAVEAAGANAAVNGVELGLERLNLREGAPPAAPTMVANLTAPLLGDVAGAMAEAPAVLVCSGLLTREAEAVATVFGETGLRVSERRDSGDWSALRMESSGSSGRP